MTGLQRNISGGGRPIRSDFAEGRPRLGRMLVIVVAGLVLITGLAYGAISLFSRDPDSIPTIKAEGPYKEKPEQPGGESAPGQNMQVYQELENSGSGRGKVEHLLPPPEVPQAQVQAPVSPPNEDIGSSAAAPQPISPIMGDAPSKHIVTTVSDAPAPLAAPKPAPVIKSAPVAAIDAAPMAKTAPVVVQSSPTTNAAASSSAVLQLVSLTDQNEANRTKGWLQNKYGTELSSARLRVVKADLGTRGVFYRIQSQPIPDDEAHRICSALMKLKAECFVVRMP